MIPRPGRRAEPTFVGATVVGHKGIFGWRGVNVGNLVDTSRPLREVGRQPSTPMHMSGLCTGDATLMARGNIGAACGGMGIR